VNHDGDLIDTAEMYLRTMLEFEEEGVVALRARIAERLGHAAPSVSQDRVLVCHHHTSFR
jgi:DtxR family transcriptional regulator, Mn-dependent transcriptional regulator